MRKFNNLFYVQNFYVLIRRNLTSRKGHQNTKILIALGWQLHVALSLYWYTQGNGLKLFSCLGCSHVSGSRQMHEKNLKRCDGRTQGKQKHVYRIFFFTLMFSGVLFFKRFANSSPVYFWNKYSCILNLRIKLRQKSKKTWSFYSNINIQNFLYKMFFFFSFFLCMPCKVQGINLM